MDYSRRSFNGRKFLNPKLGSTSRVFDRIHHELFGITKKMEIFWPSSLRSMLDRSNLKLLPKRGEILQKYLLKILSSKSNYSQKLTISQFGSSTASSLLKSVQWQWLFNSDDLNVKLTISRKPLLLTQDHWSNESKPNMVLHSFHF